ncbi:hypothetical protein ACSBR1_001727 [Camellia fascicularis]
MEASLHHLKFVEVEGVEQTFRDRNRYSKRLENIEENAQSYVNTGQMHASCDVRHIVE